MSEIQPAETPAAPDQETTVVPATEVETTPVETPAEVGTEVIPDEVKTFTQEELDAVVGKRLARGRRQWEREQAAKKVQVRSAPTEVPSADQFDTPEEHTEAVVEHKADKLVQEREAQTQQAEIDEAYNEREEVIREKYDDFEQVAYNPKLPVTEAMAQTIRFSEIGPEIAYHLGTNLKEAARISRLPPLSQAREIGKIEAALVADPPQKRTTSAPPPIAPVKPGSSSTPVYDTTDPRSIDSMSTSEWIEADRKRQRKKLEEQNL
ncbi:hypothetical protein LCGC14_0470790 [marine sediment metagenome]|uniref:Scaffolding protein n=1 Tax=marine sediment metagenome TaxID=412755 RepID=A0A0F9SCE9_9ZZZZ